MVKTMKITSIQVHDDVRKKLEKLKLHSRESYNDVIERMIKDDEVPSMEEMFRRTDKLKQKRIYSTEEVVKMTDEFEEE